MNPEAVEILRDLSFWLRLNSILFPIIALPMLLFLWSQWYMIKRLFELHTTEVDKSGFGTEPLRLMFESLGVTLETHRTALETHREALLKHTFALEEYSKKRGG